MNVVREVKRMCMMINVQQLELELHRQSNFQHILLQYIYRLKNTSAAPGLAVA